MPMPLSFTRQLDVPATIVWRLITDTRKWPEWGPSIRAVDCDQRFISTGSAGRIQTAIGIWLPFSIAAFEPETYWDWQVSGLAATGHRVEPAGPEQSTLTFTVPVWAVAYGVVCHLALFRIDRLLTRNGKEHRS